MLHDALRAAIQRGPGTVISFDSLIRGDWRNVYVFGPYTSVSDIERCIGGKVATHSIEGRDDVSLIVLQSASGRLSSALVRRDVNFGSEAVGRAYPRGAATFKVRVPLAPGWGELVPSNGPPTVCY